MRKNKYVSQSDMVLNHMRKYGSITSMEAIDNYGATRLSGIIYALRAQGYNIVSNRKRVPNRFGRNASIAVYSLA